MRISAGIAVALAAALPGAAGCFTSFDIIDSDRDGLADGAEREGTATGFVTDPDSEDTDGDGVLDADDPAPTVSVCATELLFHDAFAGSARPEWTGPDDGWRVTSDGTFAIDEATVDRDGDALRWIGPRPWNDYTVSVRVRSPAGPPMAGDVGVFFHAASVDARVNHGRYDYGGINPDSGGTPVGSVVDDGAFHIFGPGTADARSNDWNSLQARVGGAAGTFAVNGVDILTWTASPNLDGSIGLRAYRRGAEFDDVIVCR
jgi:hypothetical protein